MVNENDLRIKKTYKSLASAMLSLLEEKTFAEITVRELCDKAMIRTATFYRHFTDKYDYFAFMIKNIYNEYNKHNKKTSIPNGIDYYLWIVKDGLTMVSENPILVKAAQSDEMMAIIMDSMRKEMRIDLYNHLVQEQNNGLQLATDPELLTELLIGSLNQVSKWWIANQDKCSIDELSARLEKYVRRVIGV